MTSTIFSPPLHRNKFELTLIFESDSWMKGLYLSSRNLYFLYYRVIIEGVRSKRVLFSYLGLQVRIERAYQIPINFSLLWLVKYYLNNSSNY